MVGVPEVGEKLSGAQRQPCGLETYQPRSDGCGAYRSRQWRRVGLLGTARFRFVFLGCRDSPLTVLAPDSHARTGTPRQAPRTPRGDFERSAHEESQP